MTRIIDSKFFFLNKETPPLEDSPDDVAANKPPHTLELKGKAAIETPLYEESRLLLISSCRFVFL